jgi:hypothetical protein
MNVRTVEEYAKRLAGRGQRTMEMVQGQVLHERATKDIPTIDEYGVEKFQRDLKAGKRIVLREVKMHSRQFMGLRGTADKLTIQQTSPKHFWVQVTENKSHIYQKSYNLQLVHYALIVSAHDFEIAYRYETETKGEIRAFPVYPNNSVLDVDLILRIGLESNGEIPKYYLYPFMRNNHPPPDPYSANWVRVQIINHEKRANGYVKKRKLGTRTMKTRVLGLRDMHKLGGYALSSWENTDDSNQKTRVVQTQFGKQKLLTQAKVYNVMYRKLKPIGKTEDAKMSEEEANLLERYNADD